MNYFGRGILDKEREIELAKPSACITRKMTAEEMAALNKKSRTAPSKTTSEVDEYICRRIGQ